MGVVIIIVGIMLIIAHKNKSKKKKNRTTWHGKSDWERAPITNKIICQASHFVTKMM